MDSSDPAVASTERGRRFARRLRRALAAVRDVILDNRPGTVAKLLVAAVFTVPLWYPLRPRSAEGWLLVFVVSLLGLPVALHAATRDPDGGTNETAPAPDRMSDVGGTTPERDGSDAVVDADDLDPETERLLAHLAEFAESGIRPPTRSRMARFGDYHPEAYVERFGSWEAALAAAGVDGDGNGTDAD